MQQQPVMPPGMQQQQPGMHPGMHPGMQPMDPLKKRKVGDPDYWKNGLFSCCGKDPEYKDPEICWASTCAPFLLMGRMNEYTGECEGGFIFGCCCEVCTMMFAPCLMAVPLVTQAQSIKERGGIIEETAMVFLKACCCFPCFLCQVGHEMVYQQKIGLGPDIRLGMKAKGPGMALPSAGAHGMHPPGPGGPPGMHSAMGMQQQPPMQQNPMQMQSGMGMGQYASGMQMGQYQQQAPPPPPMQQNMQMQPGPHGPQVNYTTTTYVVHHQVQQQPISVQDPTLPQGWVSGKDPNTGRTYYYNAALNRTQWDKPTSSLD